MRRGAAKGAGTMPTCHKAIIDVLSHDSAMVYTTDESVIIGCPPPH